MSKIKEFHAKMLPYFDGYRISSEVRDFIICQFALESNYGDSRLAKEYNNYCGMRYPVLRLTKVVEGDFCYDGFAAFSSIQFCVDDYFLCLQYHRMSYCMWQSLEAFKDGISWYCPEKDYANKITKIYNQLLKS